MTDKIVVLPTCAAASDAERRARALVDGRLAACVNVVPGVRSFYHWNGETQSSEEYLLIVKTSRDLFDALRAEMEKLHQIGRAHVSSDLWCPACAVSTTGTGRPRAARNTC